MLEILLIRHGRTEWNTRALVMGRRPVPLDGVGRAQAEGLSRFLIDAGLRAIVSSPVERAVQTARIIAEKQGEISVELDERLSEIDYGDWVGLSFADLAEKYAEGWHGYKHAPLDAVLPGGEAVKDVVERIADAVDDVRSRFDDGRVALVSHADPIKIALAHLLGFDVNGIARFSIDNCAMLLVRCYPDVGPRLVLYNSRNGFGKDL